MKLALIVLLAACGSRVSEGPRSEEVVSRTMDALERDPALVDELVARARLNPAVLDRLYDATARASEDPDFARQLADQLVKHPQALRQVLFATIDAAADNPAAQQALVGAFELRAGSLARFLERAPEELASLAMSFFDQASRSADPATRKQMAVFLDYLNNKPRRVRLERS
jgi:hypothetical protein